jgi:hypothetical protein
MNITFIEDGHIYRDEAGRELPSVTTILKEVGLIESHGTEWHMDRGSAVHRTIELHEKGTLDESVLDPVLRPYLQAWMDCKAKTGLQVEEMERVVAHPVYRYAGRVDGIGTLGGKTALSDIKTGAFQRWWILQSAAYNLITKCARQISIELRDDGTWGMTEHKDKTAAGKFLACLTVYNLRKER